MRLLAAVLALSLLTAQPVSATHDAATALNTNEALLRDLVRDHRGYIMTNATLNHGAHDRAIEIYREFNATGSVSHAGFSWYGPGCWGTLGEMWGYVAADPGVTYTAAASWIVAQWHASPHHEPMFHDGIWDRMGVGVVGNAYEGRFYIVHFADC